MNTEEIKLMLPRKKRHLVTDEIAEMINKELADETTREEFRENFITYANVLTGEKVFKIREYINAIKFVTLRLLNYGIFESWAKTFPERYKRMLDEGRDDEYMRPYASMYAKTMLVTQIMKQTVVPTYILNAPLHQEAINIAMNIARNEKINAIARVNAAKTVLEYTKQPEVQNIQLDMGIKDVDELIELRKATNRLADLQLKQLEAGNITLKEVAESNIIEAEEV